MAAHKKTTKRMDNREIIIIAVIVIVAVVAAFFFYSASKTKTNAIAEVNGVQISQEDLNEIALTIPQQLRSNVTDADLLEQAINFEILRQEAGKLGITITDAEVDAGINASLESAGLTVNDLKESIRQQGISWETLFNAYKKQLLSFKFLNETILKNITVTESDMKELYGQYSAELNVSYEDAKSELNRTVLVIKSQQMLGDFLKEKRLEYEIVRYA